MRARLLVIGLLLTVGVGAFLGGRASKGGGGAAPRPRSFEAGYLAGREDAFGSYDGGWGYGDFYVVTLRRAGRGITYEFARRWPMRTGFEYRRCGSELCSRPFRR